MDKVALILDQIEESKRLIRVGKLSDLRMALILLDNAAEVLMHRKVEHEIGWSDYWEDDRKKLASWRAKDRLESREIEDETSGTIISSGRKRDSPEF
jgi:hypothetical protein